MVKDRPPIPENATHFQYHYGYKPATVIKWEWSYTFGTWSALVEFADGYQCYTYPEPDYHKRYRLTWASGLCEYFNLILQAETREESLDFWGEKADTIREEINRVLNCADLSGKE